MPTKNKTEYIINTHTGIAHKLIGGLAVGGNACHVEQIHYERKALKLDRVFYRKLCRRCFNIDERAPVVAHALGA